MAQEPEFFFGGEEDGAGLVEGFDCGGEVLAAEVFGGGDEKVDAFVGLDFDLLFDDACGVIGGNGCEKANN